MPDQTVEPWLAALEARHMQALSRAEFLKAIRALSARYVEQRIQLPHRSPLDSAGKRAAFAAFFAPLHYFTARDLLRALGAARRPIDTIVDLGCGTGVAGAAWAGALDRSPHVEGVDRQGWAVDEANWTWRALGVRGRARRGDLVTAAQALVDREARDTRKRLGVVLGWSVNELETPERRRLQPLLLELARRGSAVLIIEPLARRVTPWWDDWAAAFTSVGGRAHEWKLDLALPARLSDLDAAAGFQREGLAARTISV
jgi:hypothetical protein